MTKYDINRNDLLKLISQLEQFATIDPKMQVGTVMVLLTVAEEETRDRKSEDFSNHEVIERTGLTANFVSRNLGYWGDGHKQVSQAFKMVERDFHLDDARKRVFSLNIKGGSFVRKMLQGKSIHNPTQGELNDSKEEGE